MCITPLLLKYIKFILPSGTPMAAMTGTADRQTCSIMSSQLALKDALTVYVSPNRENLRFAVKKTTKDRIFGELDWLIELVKQNGVLTDKTIFCNTVNDIASVVNYLMLKLGKAAYHAQESHVASNCIIGTVTTQVAGNIVRIGLSIHSKDKAT